MIRMFLVVLWVFVYCLTVSSEKVVIVPLRNCNFNNLLVFCIQSNKVTQIERNEYMKEIVLVRLLKHTITLLVKPSELN